MRSPFFAVCLSRMLVSLAIALAESVLTDGVGCHQDDGGNHVDDTGFGRYVGCDSDQQESDSSDQGGEYVLSHFSFPSFLIMGFMVLGGVLLSFYQAC